MIIVHSFSEFEFYCYNYGYFTVCTTYDNDSVLICYKNDNKKLTGYFDNNKSIGIVAHNDENFIILLDILQNSIKSYQNCLANIINLYLKEDKDDE